MPAVNGVGELGAGEPHAQFDGRALETGRPPVGHLRVPGRCAEKRHHDGLVGTQPTDQSLPRQRSSLLRIQRQRKIGSSKAFVYTWPSKKALASIMVRVKTITKQGTSNPLSDLLRQLNSALRGWTAYFRHGVSKATFSYLSDYTWHRVYYWLRRKHRRAKWKFLRDAIWQQGRGRSRAASHWSIVAQCR